MKTKLWMLGVAVAALTSCTQSEVLDIPESRVIGFEPFVGKSTRVADVSAIRLFGAGGADNDLNAFWVFGQHTPEEEDAANTIFDETKIYWDSDNSSFKYDTPQQWHLGNYSFAAYSNGNNSLDEASYEHSTGTYTFTDYSNDGNKDLVAADPFVIEKTETNIREGVKLNFKHMLACVELKFTNASDAFALDFQNVKFTAKSQGSCTYSSSSISWELGDDTKDYEFVTNIYDPEGSDEAHKNPAVLLQPAGTTSLYCFVIPQNNANIKLTFDVVSYNKTAQTNDDETTSYEYTYSSTDSYEALLAVSVDNNFWNPGYVYRYIAEISGVNHYINFSVQSIEPWTSDSKPAKETVLSPTKTTAGGSES